MITSDERSDLIKLWVESFGAKPLVSVQEAAQLTSVHENTIRKAIEEGALSSARLGQKLIRISLPKLALWVTTDTATLGTWEPGAPPVKFANARFNLSISPGKPIESITILWASLPIEHPRCLKNISIRLLPMVASCKSEPPSSLINGFARLQSCFHRLWIDVLDQNGETRLEKPLSVGDCTPLDDDYTDIGLKCDDIIMLRPDYRNAKANGKSGYDFEDGAIIFRPDETVTVTFIGEPIPRDVISLDNIPVKIDITYGLYGF